MFSFKSSEPPSLSLLRSTESEFQGVVLRQVPQLTLIQLDVKSLSQVVLTSIHFHHYLIFIKFSFSPWDIGRCKGGVYITPSHLGWVLSLHHK